MIIPAIVVIVYVVNWIFIWQAPTLMKWLAENHPDVLTDWPIRHPWFIPVGIAGAPMGFLFRWIWTTLARVTWLATLPPAVQLFLPPILLLVIAVEMRGFVARLPPLSRLVLVGVELGCCFAFCWPGVFSEAPIWLSTSFFSWAFYSYAALVTPWLGEKGRARGFWSTAARLLTTRFYGPGGMFQLRSLPRDQHPLGNARNASLDEVRKGGLLG